MANRFGSVYSFAARRIDHLHALVNQKDEEILHKSFKGQWMYPEKKILGQSSKGKDKNIIE